VLNPLELPATAVPTGLSASGLPVGVQVAGRRHADALTLRVAEWIEREAGGYRAPSIGSRPEGSLAHAPIGDAAGRWAMSESSGPS
jgi:hypothetical protein